MAIAIKEFEIHEGTEGDSMWYKIEIWFRGNFVEMILRPTMLEARQQLEEEGYKLQFPLTGG